MFKEEPQVVLLPPVFCPNKVFEWKNLKRQEPNTSTSDYVTFTVSFSDKIF